MGVDGYGGIARALGAPSGARCVPRHRGSARDSPRLSGAVNLKARGPTWIMLRYASFSQLQGRCQRVGGMVSLMLAHVIGFREPALDYMSDLGIATGADDPAARYGGSPGARPGVFAVRRNRILRLFGKRARKTSRSQRCLSLTLMRLSVAGADSGVFRQSRAGDRAARPTRPVRDEGRVRPVPADAEAHRNLGF